MPNAFCLYRGFSWLSFRAHSMDAMWQHQPNFCWCEEILTQFILKWFLFLRHDVNKGDKEHFTSLIIPAEDDVVAFPDEKSIAAS